MTYYSTKNAINMQFSRDLPAGRRHKGFKAIYTVLSNAPPGKRAIVKSLIFNHLKPLEVCISCFVECFAF